MPWSRSFRHFAQRLSDSSRTRFPQYLALTWLNVMTSPEYSPTIVPKGILEVANAPNPFFFETSKTAMPAETAERSAKLFWEGNG